MELKDNGEYCIDIDDVINNSEFTEEDLTSILGEKIDYVLTNLSARTYRVLYSAYNGWEQAQQKLELQYMINSGVNADEYQDVMRDAIIEYVRGAMYSGLDMQVYLGNKGYSSEVKDILYAGGLWIIGDIIAADDVKAT